MEGLYVMQLKHHGVKGMRWGIRRQRISSNKNKPKDPFKRKVGRYFLKKSQKNLKKSFGRRVVEESVYGVATSMVLSAAIKKTPISEMVGHRGIGVGKSFVASLPSSALYVGVKTVVDRGIVNSINKDGSLKRG